MLPCTSVYSLIVHLPTSQSDPGRCTWQVYYRGVYARARRPLCHVCVCVRVSAPPLSQHTFKRLSPNTCSSRLGSIRLPSYLGRILYLAMLPCVDVAYPFVAESVVLERCTCGYAAEQYIHTEHLDTTLTTAWPFDIPAHRTTARMEWTALRPSSIAPQAPPQRTASRRWNTEPMQLLTLHTI